jgi:hypothetical protein
MGKASGKQQAAGAGKQADSYIVNNWNSPR